MRIAALVLSGLLSTAFLATVAAQGPANEGLQPPSAFQSIGDPAQRSRAIFTEVGKLLTHPRCLNCHPAGDQPLQGAEHRIHWPPAKRAGLGDTCVACHTDRNVTLHAKASYQSIPGHPR
jgi:hypothetical protein